MANPLKKEELIPFLTNRNVNFNISRSCFTKCKGCYNFFNKDDTLIETLHIENFLRFLHDNNVANKITFAGGDPLSRPDIIQLLILSKNLGFRIHLDTVGSPLLGNTRTIFYGKHSIGKVEAESLKVWVDLLGIPLDGSTDKIFEEFREGRKNIVEEQKEILRMLEEQNIPVCINTVVSQKNHFDIENIADIILGFNNIERWQIFQYMPIGILGNRSRQIFEIDDSLYEKTVIKAQEKLKNSLVRVEGKTTESRRHQYCFVDSTGQLWLPTDGEDILKLGNIKDINW